MYNINDIRKEVRKIYEHYDGIRVGIAGSYANNTAREKSDIDIVIDGDSTRQEIADYAKTLFNKIAAELKLRAIKDVARFLCLAGIKPNHIEGIRESKSTKEKIVLSQEMYEELLLDAFDIGKTPINLLRSNPKKYIGRSTTPAVATCSKVINEAQEIYNNK